ncbi:phytanoyl-CoA dioxygenase family protein [Neobacillus drentensis]|uniref:phytanoyl-CoA dioxygenase family protein n=1 Tax=Neobacillus drentensis TaxID=220684 RepID=UPI0030029C1E
MNVQEKIKSFTEALTIFGVNENTLTEQEKKDLDEKGFVIFENLIDEKWLNELREKYNDLVEIEGAEAGTEVHQEAGTHRLSNLMNKGEVFDGCYTHPKVLASIYHIIKREFKVSAMNGRDAVKGHGLQALHEDWNDSFFEEGVMEKDGDYRNPADPFNVAISLWMLDDFKEDNGATRVVPGTHLKKAPQFYLKDRLADHPEQVLVTGKAGTVAVMNSHLWHGGTNNLTGESRRVLHPYYVAREFKQQQDQRKYITKETYDRISPAARYLLDVEGAF